MVYASSFLSKNRPSLEPVYLGQVVKLALKEDIGAGDITTRLSIPKGVSIRAQITAKENFLLCGMGLAQEAFKQVDPKLKFQPKAKDGQRIKRGQALAVISGRAGGILTAERVALNFLSFLSGVATKTSIFASKVYPFKTMITDTRKTLPGLRVLQKYAVRIGSGYNHRLRLDEMLLVKDNHLKIMGGYSKLPPVPAGFKLEIESQNLKEFARALSFKPDVIMLDNMSIPDIRRAVAIRNRLKAGCASCKTLLEASGGINLVNIRKYAACGVEIISIGELTDSVNSADISLDVL